MAQNVSSDYECTYFGYWLGTILHVTEEGGHENLKPCENLVLSPKKCGVSFSG